MNRDEIYETIIKDDEDLISELYGEVDTKKRLHLTNVRTLELVTIDTIKKHYDELMLCYMSELYTDIKDMEESWFEKYYKEPYENLFSICKDFINNDNYKLNIKFENACELYNHMSEDIDRVLKFEEGHITKEIADSRLNFMSIEVDRIRDSIFKKEKIRMNEDEFISGYRSGKNDTLKRVFDCIVNTFDEGRKQIINEVIYLLVVEQIDNNIPVEKRRENIHNIIDRELDNWIDDKK